MRRARPLLLALVLAPLLGLAGCGGRTAMSVPEGVDAADPRIGPCRSEAAAAPELRAIARRQPPLGSGEAYDRWREDLTAAERNGFLACLVREGALPEQRFGVEPVRNPRFGFDDRAPPPPLRALPQAPRPAPSGF